MDQATELRRMINQLHAEAGAAAGSARVLAVTSGKGGVGKTNIAVNLAARLATMSRRIVLIDGDLGLANADVVAGVTPGANLAHVIAGRRSLDDAMCDGPGGFTLLAGASGLAQMANLSEFERARILQMMRQLDRDHDLILVDTGAGIGPNVLSFLLAADEILVVTTPEPSAVTDAYALIKTLCRRKEHVKVNLLVNMAQDRHDARRAYERINAVCRRFLGLSLLDAGYIPQDLRVGAAVRRRRPFVLDDPESPASVCITQLAHKLDRHATEIRGVGFFRRVTSWLTG